MYLFGMGSPAQYDCFKSRKTIDCYLSRSAQYSGLLLPWATAQTVITDSCSE
jgi:hypothetical protein